MSTVTSAVYLISELVAFRFTLGLCQINSERVGILKPLEMTYVEAQMSSEKVSKFQSRGVQRAVGQEKRKKYMF